MSSDAAASSPVVSVASPVGSPQTSPAVAPSVNAATTTAAAAAPPAAGHPPPTQSWTLFVGQVPNDVNESSLKHLFSTYGLVTECKILMDKVANKPRGCGFISYADKLGAETAIATLHEKYTLPGSARPLIVRYSTKQLAADKSDPGPFKLYISNLSKLTTEPEIRTMFSPYGELIDDVVILKDQSTGTSRGVAFVRFSKKSEAENAIHALNEQVRDKDAANMMQVKFAHTASEKKQLLQKQMSMGALGGMNGGAHQMQAAAAAAAQMGGYYTPAHFNPAYAPAGYNPYAMPPHMYAAYAGQVHGGHPVAHPHVVHHPHHHHHQHHHHGHGGHGHRVPVTKGPEGANLFVYGIPESYTDTDLSGLFVSFGHVINAKVYRDLATGNSKGFGFVSYDTVPPAQQACASMNGYVIAGKKLTVKPKSESNTQRGDSANSQQPQQQPHAGQQMAPQQHAPNHRHQQHQYRHHHNHNQQQQQQLQGSPQQPQQPQQPQPQPTQQPQQAQPQQPSTQPTSQPQTNSSGQRYQAY